MEKDWLNHIGPNPGTRHRRHCYAAGYKAGLLAGLREIEDRLSHITSLCPAHDYGDPGYPPSECTYCHHTELSRSEVVTLLAHVEATGELPEEAAEE